MIKRKGRKTLQLSLITIIILLLLPGCQEGPTTDIDGNIYNTVVIGGQIWMKENLKTTRFNDGSPIPYIAGDADWSVITSPGFCWFDNEENPYKGHLGGLYNWYAVNSGKLCPTGWSVSGIEDWQKLSDNLGGDHIAGGKLKDTARQYWVRPNAGATNETGFSAQAGGYRSPTGTFGYRGFDGYWWTTTENSVDRATGLSLSYNFTNLGRQSNNKKSGFSVRCIKDI